MTNLYHQIEFHYYSRDHSCFGNYTLIGKSSVVGPLNYNESTRIHLAYGNHIDEMDVSYLTNISEYIPQYQYELSPSSLNFHPSETTITYTAFDICKGKAVIRGPQTFIDHRYMHIILLENLQAWTVNVTCLLHIGDISYVRGIGALWDAFITQIQPIAALVPYMVEIGNHEGNHGTDSDDECAVPMVRRFHSPLNDNSLFWYNLDVGPIHRIYYSTEHDFRRTSLQYSGIEDLHSV
ncbi:unnamed protein product [Rotaria sordida]|uniref:Acid phosphatase n=1 Tax=Rotaria sordida TaxID=392033 RepID=A0A813NF95_9BILA|nr:unnamed protein product [Rotaria sordida]CAF0753213.1 unnamed protein product [Rotaria sordida]